MSSLVKVIKIALVAGSLACGTNAAATALYNSTGGVENGGDPLATAGPVLADRFLTTNATDLTSVTLNLSSSGPSSGGFSVDLFSSSAAGPGKAIVLANVADSALTTAFKLYTYKPTGPVTLAANTYYYIGISSLNSNVVLGNTVDNNVLSRPSVAAGGYYYNNGGVQANSGGPYELVVNAGVPEPTVWALMLIGVGGIGWKARTNRKLAVAAT